MTKVTTVQIQTIVTISIRYKNYVVIKIYFNAPTLPMKYDTATRMVIKNI